VIYLAVVSSCGTIAY